MRPTSKTFIAAAATLFASAFFVMTAPAAYADDYCITNGAQVAHGCGYPSMETCQAASAGIGGTCARSASAASTNPSDAQAKQQRPRSAIHTRKQPVGQ